MDAIALTGSLVFSQRLLDSLKEKISFIAPIYLNPGENEMEALADAALRYFSKEEELSTYRAGEEGGVQSAGAGRATASSKQNTN